MKGGGACAALVQIEQRLSIGENGAGACAALVQMRLRTTLLSLNGVATPSPVCSGTLQHPKVVLDNFQ